LELANAGENLAPVRNAVSCRRWLVKIRRGKGGQTKGGSERSPAVNQARYVTQGCRRARAEVEQKLKLEGKRDRGWRRVLATFNTTAGRWEKLGGGGGGKIHSGNLIMDERGRENALQRRDRAQTNQNTES